MIKKLISWRRCGRPVLHIAATAGHPDLGDISSPYLVRPIAGPRNR
jgi:hypothetical protein